MPLGSTEEWRTLGVGGHCGPGGIWWQALQRGWWTTTQGMVSQHFSHASGLTLPLHQSQRQDRCENCHHFSGV